MSEQLNQEPEQTRQLDPSIDPNRLIVQEGLDEGRIADHELAQIGAEAYDAKLEQGPVMANVSAELAMAKTIGERAVQLRSQNSPASENAVSGMAGLRFLEKVHEERDNIDA